ncbi:MAG: cytochrome c oxidase assembly protein [Gammaproteobacteria bacterium]|nr:MAG: cytochrome c oxidase assembly protein [Gammaproteobacteria bacterium]
MAGQKQIRASKNKLLLIVMVVAVLSSFGFGYALVPLYDLLCDITGLNGKTGRLKSVQTNTEMLTAISDVFSRRERWVMVQFNSDTGTGLPWEFKPLVNKIRVRLGEQNLVYFLARNTSNETITGQAVPNVVPGRAARHFKKVECFCFSKQTLKPGETKKMPVRFVVQKGLDKRVDAVVLSYTFFNTDKVSAKKYSKGKISAIEFASHGDVNNHVRHQ